MILKCTSFEEMQKEIIERNMSIVIWGAGVVGTVTTPEILEQYDLIQKVAFYVDNNPEMQGRSITVGNRLVEIKAVDVLNITEKRIVLIIAVSRYAEILKQLGQMVCTRDVTCYIMPMMCIHNFCGSTSDGAPTLSDKPLIPKKFIICGSGEKKFRPNCKSVLTVGKSIVRIMKSYNGMRIIMMSINIRI